MATLSAPSMVVPRVATRSLAPHAAGKTAQKAKTSVAFPGNAKYPRMGAAPPESLDLYQVIRYPIVTEAAVKLIESDNTLVFVVDARADKKMIRDAVRGLLGVEASRVNTLLRPDGAKKAYVKLAPSYAAADVANRIGMF